MARRVRLSGTARLRWRRLLRAGLIVAAGLTTVLVLVNSRDELLTALTKIGQVQPGWVLLAAAAEGFSYLAYAAGQWLLMRRAGGTRLGLAPVAATAVVAQAAANCIPGGLAISSLVSYRVFTRRGVVPAVTAWVLVLGSAVYLTALGLIALVAVRVAGASNLVPGLQAVSLGIVGCLVLLCVAAVVVGPRLDLPAVEAAFRDRLRRRRHRPDRPDDATPVSWTRQLMSFKASGRVLVVVLGLMLASWLFDVAVLVIAFQALGDGVPWRGLLLAYAAAQVASSVPITPGGLGVVEGSLTLALVAFGGAEQSTLTAVLLYRLMSFWLVIPSGAAGWGLLQWQGRRQTRVTAPGHQLGAGEASLSASVAVPGEQR